MTGLLYNWDSPLKCNASWVLNKMNITYSVTRSETEIHFQHTLASVPGHYISVLPPSWQANCEIRNCCLRSSPWRVKMQFEVFNFPKRGAGCSGCLLLPSGERSDASDSSFPLKLYAKSMLKWINSYLSWQCHFLDFNCVCNEKLLTCF